MLESMGYHVVSAASGEEALELFDEHRAAIELVLTDLKMPGMGGAAACGALHARGATTPIIVLSGSLAETDLERLVSHPPADCLQKPVEVEQLAYALQRALQATR